MKQRALRLLRLLNRLEFRALFFLLGVGAALTAFLQIAEAVEEGETHDLDRNILLLFREPGRPDDPLGPRFVEEALRDVTALGGFTVLTLITVIGVIVLWFYGWKRRALVFGGAVLLAQVSADLTKIIVGRDRPDFLSHGSFVYSHSFPSGHSTISATVFFTLAAVLASLQRKRRAKIFIFSVAALLVFSIGLSRLYLGVHWPSDVLAGWTLGAGWALAARLALGGLLRPADAPPRFQRLRRVPGVGPTPTGTGTSDAA